MKYLIIVDETELHHDAREGLWETGDYTYFIKEAQDIPTLLKELTLLKEKQEIIFHFLVDGVDVYYLIEDYDADIEEEEPFPIIAVKLPMTKLKAI